jgi:replicative DNA helicase
MPDAVPTTRSSSLRPRGARREDDARAGEGPGPTRSLPHSPEAEEYLLSCCLLDGSDTIAKCLEKKLPAEAFAARANQIIYTKLVELYNQAPPVAIEVLAEELKTTGQLEEIGGFAYLMQVSGRIPTTAQADYFLERVRELYLLRQLIKVGTSAVERCYAYQGGLEEFIDKIEQDIFAVTQDRVSDGAQQMRGPRSRPWASSTR